MSIVQDFTTWHYEYGKWEDTTFLGVQCVQNPNDAWIIQELIYKTKPELIVECGTCGGGSALLWAMLLENTTGGEVITIDRRDVVDKKALNHRLWDRVTFIHDDTVNAFPEVEARANKSTMVILDSDHGTSHVTREMEVYSTLVPVDHYMIVQDTILNNVIDIGTGPGPFQAVEAFLKANDDFKVDTDCERNGHTHHPGGYLKRIK